MGKDYARELMALPEAFAWALSSEIGGIQRFVHRCGDGPLLAIGSGGSVAAAHFAALLHRRVALGMSRHATPLEALLDESAIYKSAVLVLSASGKNADVLAAARTAIAAEVKALGIVCMSQNSPLAADARAYPRGFVFDNPIPTGKDGYLATNSLLATLVVLARAYGSFNSPIDVSPPVFAGDWPGRDFLVVLHGGWSSPVATDVESRIHESAMLHVQTSDYRNFGHGRHLWLAKRETSTAVLALVTPETTALANKTLRLFPKGVPVIQVVTNHPGPAGTIDLFAKVLHWTRALAEHLRVDPGKPSVPGFGRRIFHLSPPKSSALRSANPALQRKLDRVGLVPPDVQQSYTDAYACFRTDLASLHIGAVVLDYDGTLVLQDERFGALPNAIAVALQRLLNLGLSVGIATGRGRSVRQALRDALPPMVWHNVHVGYYNGADISTLADDALPDASRPTSKVIADVARILQNDLLLKGTSCVEVRPDQVTVTLNDTNRSIALYQHLADLLFSEPMMDIRLLRSAHSIDVVESRTSKLNVVRRLADMVRPRTVLCIGDRGGWPGNDLEFLGHWPSLSADEVSSKPATCWNLAPRGCIGPAATLRYLAAIECRSGKIAINVDSIEHEQSST